MSVKNLASRERLDAALAFRPVDRLYALPPNRVRRNYRGGALLDMLAGAEVFRDGDQPEDWIASTVEARNPGLPPRPGEGISQVIAPDGTAESLVELLAAHSVHFMGGLLAESLGPRLGFLAKLLDSAMRLHVQAHPTAAFAQEHLGSRWGKLEAYVILGVRPGHVGYIRLGFQRPPTPAEWRRIVLEQDVAAMDTCFDNIPVTPGEVWVVPGGLPHAIGEGLLVLEIMEPTDLVVRCEFEREGIVVPPDARFMGRDPDFALQVFDFTALTPDAVKRRCRISPVVECNSPALCTERLIGPEQTECFEVRRHRIRGTATLPPLDAPRVFCPVTGHGRLRAGGAELTLRPGTHGLAAAASAIEIEAAGGGLEWIECRPGYSR